MEKTMESSSNIKGVTSVVVFMRHGERVDVPILNQKVEEWEKHDPRITKNGCKDAYEKGLIWLNYKK